MCVWLVSHPMDFKRGQTLYNLESFSRLPSLSVSQSLSLLSKITFFLCVFYHLSFSSMGSDFHYSIDLNEDQNHHEQPFLYPFGSSSSILHNQQQHHHHNHQVPSNSSSSISSLSSYLPFLINSQEDQHVAYNNTYQYEHLNFSQPLKVHTHTHTKFL